MKSNTGLHYKGYIGVYGFEDGAYHGRVSGLKLDMVTFQADSEDAIEKEFQLSVDDYLEFCEEKGKPPEAPR